jgi:type IV pilus assembly protein PilF
MKNMKKNAKTDAKIKTKIASRIGVVVVVVAAVVLVACGSTQKNLSQANASTGAQTELRTSSDQTPEQNRASIRLQLAIGYFQQRELNIALDEVKQALQADPLYADAYGVRALIYMDKGEIKLAEDNFVQALKLAPNNPDFQSNYGWFLCQNKREDQSIALFDSALKNRTYGSPVKAMNNAGVCSLKLRNATAAEEYFLSAFKLEPGNSISNFNLAKLYCQRGDVEKAQFYMLRLINTDKSRILELDVLWLGVKIAHKVGDLLMETSLGTQLRRHYANSAEYSAYQRGAFDE